MLLSDFNYTLDEKHIAKYPPTVRGESNLLIIDTNTKSLQIDLYHNLYKYIQKNSDIFLNDTKVMPARLICKSKNSDKSVELFILENHSDGLKYDGCILKCIVKGKVKVLDILYINDVDIQCIDISANIYTFKLTSNIDIIEFMTRYGHTPIPPYMDRDDDENDKTRYQTISAKNLGSVAAPTASLNITDDLLINLQDKGIDINYLTLHCGYGTFKPINTVNVEEHNMHSEYFELDKKIQEMIMSKNRPITAVGTTVTRTLEYAHESFNNLDISNDKIYGEANIYLYPGKKFHVIDNLVTNFHAPKSTPLMLAMGFITDKLSKNSGNKCINELDIEDGKKFLYKAYDYAIENKFKFLSYGDSMLIL